MPEIEVFDEIDWEPKPILRPGMDFHDGVAYFTIPLTRNVVKPGKGKDADPIKSKEIQTFVINSNHEGFWYDAEGLEAEGFIPSEQVFEERETRWSLPSAKAFLDEKTPNVTSKELFGTIRSIYTKHVEFASETFYDIMSLFIMYSYIFRLFESTGYVHFNGSMASGKSRNLSIINALAFNSVWASNMSAASLYRKLAGSPGTTCIDESEGWEGERGEELRRILNAGYVEGAKVIRTEKASNERWMPVQYDVFGPKALASINPLEDVIASRCLIIGMRPAIRELPDFENKDGQWDGIRDSLYLWAMDNSVALSTLRDEWHGDKKSRLSPKLIGRQWETTRQFVILADLVGGEDFATKIIEFLNVYFAKQQDALNATDRIRTTLRCLPRVLATKMAHPGHLYSIKDIHEVVSSYLEADAAEYFKTKHVGKNLDTLGFKHKVRAAGGLRVELDETALRNEFAQRRVEPFEEDQEWLSGITSYQDQPPPPSVAERPEEGTPWWDTSGEEEE